ncbi:MAG: RNA polymerase sigma factor [Planctomycetes bacterium]|nr:RNA polymerase sigma factor [Planctomycetota bacterium]
MSEPSTTTLIREFTGGRRDAFRTLYHRIAPRLYLWAALRVPRALHARLDPEDLMQEIWLRAVAALPRFDRSIAAFRSWLFGIAARTLAENLRHLHLRRRERVADGDTSVLREVPADVTSVIHQVAHREQLRRLVEVIDALPAPDRSLVVHRGLEERPHAEVARLLGIGADAAEMRWRRLLQRLRGEWTAAGFDVE